MIEGPRVSFSAWVHTDDIARVGSVFGTWAGRDALEPEDGIATSEISLDEDDLELYGYEFTDAQGVRSIQVDGSLPGSAADARPRLEDLLGVLKELGGQVVVEYNELDEDGTPLSDEVRLT